MALAGSEYKPADHVVMTEVEGEAVLLHVATGQYYGLDEIGTAVWRMLTEGKSAGQMVQWLFERYDADQRRLSSDVERLLADLRHEGLIEST